MIATRVAAAAVMSFPIVHPFSPHEDRTYPQDGEGNGRVPVHRSPRSFPLRVGSGGCVVRPWAIVEVKPLAVAELGVRYRRYRLADAAAEEAMMR